MPDASVPRYHVPAPVLLDLALAVLFGGRRSFGAHARRMQPGIIPSPVVSGEKNIPASGPGLITVNHYFRPGFWSPWFPAVISAQVPVDIHWTMTDAFTYPGQQFGALKRQISHILLLQIARVYGFDSMPPMPPAPNEVSERAASVQRLISYARSHPDALIGLAPEGGDQPGGRLTLPPEGFGRLAMLFARKGYLIFPVGVFEQDGRLRVCFGAPYCLEIAETGDRTGEDLQARRQVMQAIAACLPEQLRGEF